MAENVNKLKHALYERGPAREGLNTYLTNGITPQKSITLVEDVCHTVGEEGILQDW